MMRIRQIIYILSIITKEMGKLKTHSPTYCKMDNWENMHIRGNNMKDQYTGMAVCLNCVWSNINHCHCVFIDIVMDSFLIIWVHSFDTETAKWGRPFGEDRLGKQWQAPIQRLGRLSELYSIQCYIFSLTFNSFLIHSFASRPNGAS